MSSDAKGPQEVLWASRIPLHAAARVGKVHLQAEGSLRTLCGLHVPPPRKQFFPRDSDERCSRCAARAAREAAAA